MTKLLITLSIAIGLTISAFVLIIETVPETLLAKSISQYDHASVKGTVTLLDDEIEGLNDNERELRVAELNRLFGYPIEFRHYQSLDLTPEHLALLNEGLTASLEIDEADVLYSPSRYPEMLWVLPFEETNQQSGHRQAVGTFELIEKRLKTKTFDERQKTINELATLFGFPVSLMRENTTNFSAEEIDRLQTGNIVVRNFDENNELYFRKLRDGDGVLSGGPIAYPGILNWVNYIALLFIATLIFVGLWLGLRPLWRDLRNLNHASLQLADGNLDTRVPESRTNMIGSVIKGFNYMAERTQNMIASQRELTNAVSHELRTPVARMKFGLENLRNSTSKADRERHMDDMAFDVNELDTLLSQLLTYARYESGRPIHNLQPQPIVEWLEQHIDSARRQGSSCIIDYRVTDLKNDDTAVIEPLLLGRALSNGLQNALAHARTRVNVDLTKEAKDFLLQIDDDGPGIPDTMHERVFEPFTRVDESRNRSSGGFGLGLPIVAQVARWHGGSAHIQDSALGGTCLQIRWPIEQTAAQDE